MKKFLELVLLLIVLIGVSLGMLLLNPERSISQKFLPMINIQAPVAIRTIPLIPFPHLQNTGIDLTNCVSYFDGCNNCSVKDGKPDACTMMYCEKPSEPKCLQYASGSEATGTVGNSELNTQTPPYQTGQSLYIPKVGLHFTLPNGWKLTGRETGESDGEVVTISTTQKDSSGYSISMSLSIQMETEKNGCLISYNPVFNGHGIMEKITCVPAKEITVAKLQEIKQEIKPQILEESNGVYLFPLSMDNDKDMLMAPFNKKYAIEFIGGSTAPKSSSECLSLGGCSNVSASTNDILYKSITKMLFTAKKI